MDFQQLVERNSVLSDHSAALGAAVSVAAEDRFLGIVVEVAEGRKGVWVRRLHDDADVMVHYSVRELRLATPADLANVARFFLAQQYREAVELRRKVAEHRDDGQCHPACWDKAVAELEGAE